MPHAVLGTEAVITTTGDFAARQLIPGVEPGGSRAGAATKPALLLREAWIEPITLGVTGAGIADSFSIFLKLSQEEDLTPGLLLPVGRITLAGDASNSNGYTIDRFFMAAGTIWAPKHVGIRLVEDGACGLDVNVHLDYERIDVPWMDWFIMWEFLDGIVDNEKEY